MPLQAPHQTSGAIVFDEGVIEAIQQCVDEHLKSPEIEQTVKVSTNFASQKLYSVK